MTRDQRLRLLGAIGIILAVIVGLSLILSGSGKDVNDGTAAHAYVPTLRSDVVRRDVQVGAQEREVVAPNVLLSLRPRSVDNQGSIAQPIIGGRASWVSRSLGDDYLAMRLPRGTRVRICGELGCVRRTVNDYGPSHRIYPERIADLSKHDFRHVCGSPRRLGTCRVRATILESIALPPTDTE